MPIKLIEQIYKDSQLLTAKSGDFKRVTHSYLQTLIALRFNQQNKNIFIVLPNLYEAQKYYDNLSNLLDPSYVLFFPMDQTLTSLMALGSPEFKNERLRSEEHTSELQSRPHLVCRLLLEKKNEQRQCL